MKLKNFCNISHTGKNKYNPRMALDRYACMIGGGRRSARKDLLQVK